jgi:hypothetical protein
MRLLLEKLQCWVFGHCYFTDWMHGRISDTCYRCGYVDKS